ncbi:hypothetical protein MycrhN_1769 [Mycolicibacterium rhodesiae NBB3]|jgi:hypothetical protein|uniref:Uncharacterized protein n=1 Tax=Mycolicibacterium rhodesiae (strain NBB3) TaxID=710685 RepID=G8RLB8_MYCRN|nr:hypothetical protein [Mycolicibacterium rhodesiae]AEV72380.1 hypothetical protein MycrhN_1769 [Mycolicibacterium rhodesiae NBB3]
MTSLGAVGIWARTQLRWDVEPVNHELRAPGRDARGDVQPDSTPPGAVGYNHQSILARPIRDAHGAAL